MKHIEIKSLPGFEEWKNEARICLENGMRPDKVLWQSTQNNSQSDLFGKNVDSKKYSASQNITVPKLFIEKAQIAICHIDEDRFDFLYRILWRITHETKSLLYHITDDDVIRLKRMVKNVYRDSYKMKAFLRFREIEDKNGEPFFIAKYEPEHYSLEVPMNFFTTRFANMNWAIITPYRAAFWDKKKLTYQDNPDFSLFPEDDAFEKHWLTYYSSIFNPARVKKQAMLTGMPKKYWKHMPETKLIEPLLKDAQARVGLMLENSKQNRKNT